MSAACSETRGTNSGKSYRTKSDFTATGRNYHVSRSFIRARKGCSRNIKARTFENLYIIKKKSSVEGEIQLIKSQRLRVKSGPAREGVGEVGISGRFPGPGRDLAMEPRKYRQFVRNYRIEHAITDIDLSLSGNVHSRNEDGAFRKGEKLPGGVGHPGDANRRHTDDV